MVEHVQDPQLVTQAQVDITLQEEITLEEDIQDKVILLGGHILLQGRIIPPQWNPITRLDLNTIPKLSLMALSKNTSTISQAWWKLNSTENS